FTQGGLIADLRHAKVEDVVRKIADEERTFYRNRSKFFNFTLGDTSVNFPNKTVDINQASRDTGYVYEAFQEANDYLVIRAHPSKEELLAAWTQPQVLVFRTHPKRNDEVWEWSKIVK
ncbi:MAG: hypothetical protein G8345_03320, partial [Magnetococcales bacterium]|nr:hypothetical protein [Magnetococcales bacterium]